METVAEYVESDAILAMVRKLGVDFAQGFAIGKPQPLDKLLHDLDSVEASRMRRTFLEG
jgi:EAL domain-containing protein (putative c-di-GMP-specific phosphodiesterase class I)